MTRVYISGPVSGTTNAVKRFDAAAARLKALGFEYVNPAHLAKVMPGASHAEYMSVCSRMLGACNLVMVLPGWEDSEGCRQEHELAKRLNIPIYIDTQGEVPEYEDATRI